MARQKLCLYNTGSDFLVPAPKSTIFKGLGVLVSIRSTFFIHCVYYGFTSLSGLYPVRFIGKLLIIQTGVLLHAGGNQNTQTNATDSGIEPWHYNQEPYLDKALHCHCGRGITETSYRNVSTRCLRLTSTCF